MLESERIYERKEIRNVTTKEADEFLEMKKKDASVIARATAMCIISPAVLILLAGMSEDKIFYITEAVAAGVGLIFLFGMIAAAVFLFITCGIKGQNMEYLEKDIFEMKQEDSELIKEQRRAYEPVFAKGIARGVVLCILAVLPLLLAGIADAPDYVCCAFTSLLLVIIAIGVNFIIRVSIIKTSYDTLLQEGEFGKKEKQTKKRMDSVSGVYWCLVTAIYLGWSFLTMQWEITWMIWPVAGVLFAAITGMMKIWMENKSGI